MDKHKQISDKARADGVLNGGGGPKAPPQKPLAAAQKRGRLSSGAAGGGAGRQARPVNPPGSSIKISCRNQAEIESKVIDIAGCAPPGGFIWDGLAGKETRWGKNSEGRPNQRWSFKGSEDHTRANLYDFRERCNRHYYVKGAKPHVQWKNREPKKPEKKIDLSLDFNKLPELTTHSYFIRKKVATPKAARSLKAQAVIPVSAPDGRMISWQAISPNGEKKFKKGCPLGKGYYFRMEPMEPSEGERVYVCEGVATACSIAEITIKKYPVFCAFGKNNLEAVAEWLLEKYPERKVVMCLDHDIKHMLKPRLQHDRLIVLRPEKPGDDFNDSQKSEAEQQKLLNLKPVYEYEAPARIPKTAEDVLNWNSLEFTSAPDDPIEDINRRLEVLKYEIRLNVRKARIEIKGFQGAGWGEITDEGYSEIFLNVQQPRDRGKIIKLKRADFMDALKAAANRKQVDPFKEYLESLKWDETERLKRYLGEIFKIKPEHKELSEWALKSVLLAAVRRSYHPGAKHDEFLILKGPQGIGKSSFLYSLFSDKSLFSSGVSFSAPYNRIVEEILDKAIVEIPELAGFRKAEIEKIKNIISMQKDTCRLSYRRDAQDFFRRCVFVGTTNDQSPLPNDLTGLRRFVLISLSGKNSVSKTVKSVKKDRDQLWAEAVAAFKAGESARLPENLWLKSAEVAEAHRGGDRAFEQEFWNLIENPPVDDISPEGYPSENYQKPIPEELKGLPDKVNIPAVLKALLEKGWIRDISPKLQSTAAELLAKEGYKQERERAGGKRLRFWIKEQQSS